MASLVLSEDGEYQLSVDNLPNEYEVKRVLTGSQNLNKPLQIRKVMPAIEIQLGLRNPQPNPAAVISGRIMDGITGKRATAAWVSLLGSSGTVFNDGTFEFSGVSPGTYTIQASEGSPGQRTAEATVTVADERAIAELIYTSVPRYAGVSGRVVVNDGRPVPSGIYIVTRNTGNTSQVMGSQFAMTLINGSYELSVGGLPSGYIVKSITSGSVDLLTEPLRIEPEKGPVGPDVLVTLAVSANQ
jgi:hypothetical protein